MAPTTVQNPPAPVESKTAQKKKAKAAAAVKAAAGTESPAPASVAGGENPDDSSENGYIRELSKNIRNLNKKISNGARIENLINEHSGKSLEELVAAKIINADQAASHLKRPSLQNQLAQFEKELAMHKQIEADHRSRLSQLETTLKEKFEKEKEELVAETKQKVEAEADEKLRGYLLALSQFLRLAAARRLAEADSSIDENAAIEGVLLHIYCGDNDSVTEMLKLVQGSDERVLGVEGRLLKTTFADIKEEAYAHLNPNYKRPKPAEPEFAEELKLDEYESTVLVETDPTVANAGLTEVDDGSAVALTNGHGQDASSVSGGAPGNADVADSAANAAGENQWDTGNTISDSQEWVSVNVPRDLSETETGAAATPAQPTAPVTNQSWADEHPETAAEATTPADDGFHQVPSRSRGSRDGGHRGRGGFRGRGGGFRGDGRGRGRGRGGDRGGLPSRPRREESQG
ncbi:hypothetical protein QC761_604870 [Podospora bellae-mahoneyi]|uniref:YAG7-like dimerisation domain-containing protein n=1 Tax=Podospora bellae-mahoneyi TaxID=2093777 RepID=A0ABR0FB85_9PEZI|nr:hypothetical protein QC761_604870 [Podospora bellae-mahoneyi]